MREQIIVEQISKSYKTYIKEDGVINSIKSFFNRKYDYIQAVDNISFSIKEGEILGLIGLNGAGKTTIIKMVSGIIKQDEGIIKIFDKDPFLRAKDYRRKVALVMGQKGQLDPDLSILDSVKLFASIYSIEKTEAINRLMSMADELDLSDISIRKQVRNLSLGQRMKGELILSFIHLPVIIFLDEPTLGLDFITQRSIRKYLKYYKDKYGASIILTSHYIKDIEDLCENIYIINEGKELYYGSIDRLRSMTTNTRRVSFQASQIKIKNINKNLNVRASEDEEGTYFINFSPDKMPEIIQMLANESGISNINFNDDSLDIIIEDLYKGEKV